MRNRSMSVFDTCLFLVTALGFLAGAWAIGWARTASNPTRRLYGRWIFVATLCLLGAGAFAAAWQHADGLVPLGLSAGFLVIGMLVESPAQKLAVPLDADL